MGEVVVAEVAEEEEDPTETSMDSKLPIGYSMPTKIGHAHVDTFNHLSSLFVRGGFERGEYPERSWHEALPQEEYAEDAIA